jgi:16S rRNA (guanine527-N7)-methyltransferase
VVEDAAAAWRELEEAGSRLGLDLPDTFLAHVRVYLAELDRWNRQGPLTGYRTAGARIRHLVTESLMLLRVIPSPGEPLVDIGSGAGVPGLVLALARPGWRITLVEANRRRANFLRHMVRVLQLPGVTVEQARAEALADNLGRRFWTATMRAVPGKREVYRLAAPLLFAEGVLIATLGPQAGAPPGGRVEAVELGQPGELPWRRRFLILRGAEIEASVSRGTSRGARTEPGRRQPKGRRRQDHDCR